MLILVRHGQTESNASGLLQGRMDRELTELGRRQAVAARALVGTPHRVVTSPLARARETASLLGSGVDIEVDDRWVEMDYGTLDGLPVAAVDREVWRRWRSDPDFAPAGGESVSAVGRRVREACEELAADAADRDVLVVSHVSPIKAAVAWALGCDDRVVWRMHLDVASVTRVSIGPNGATLRGYNEVGRGGDT
ncbi:MAG TPA: histidine phosphatase family protein [Acidimicrobiales bacterium]|nr:histidine phosphatase family protein [Acidimicrobiales bacterium]